MQRFVLPKSVFSRCLKICSVSSYPPRLALATQSMSRSCPRNLDRPPLLMPQAFPTSVVKRWKSKGKRNNAPSKEVEEGEGIDLEAYHTEMQKHVEKFEKQIVNIKIGPVSPSILDDIKIEMGGELIPLASAAQVQAKDANTLVITTFHSDDATAVQKALLASSIGITPSKEDKVLKLGFPKASAEYRQELTRKVKELADKTQVRLRRERSNAIKEVKALKSVGGYGKDDIKRLEKEVASWAEAASKNVTKELDKKISELKK
eukprot:m.74712 g.74712  ORF g.74712 m.74712 type:complete len:262 (+) comp12475_c0_seq3:235-1020(+)